MSKNNPKITDQVSLGGTGTKKSKGMSVYGAAAIGIGGMVGGGIFAVLGTAASLASGGTPVAFLIAGCIALLTSYSYTKLSVKFPNAGGTVVFIDEAFGVDLWTGTLNLMLWLSYLVTIALYASAFGSYGKTFFGESSSIPLLHTIISLGIILPAVINILNADIVSKSETYIVIIKLSLLVLIIIAGIPNVHFSRLSLRAYPPTFNLIAGGMVIFVAYEGFELIANAASDVKDPNKTLPRAFYGSVLFVMVLYILISIVTVGSVAPDVIPKVKDYALAQAAKPSLGEIGFTIVAISALMATFSAINATIYGNARLGYTLAKDGELPETLEKKTWNRPVDGVLLTTVLSLLLANLVDLSSIAIMGSTGFLIIFAVVNLSSIKLSKEIGSKKIISIIGFIACTTALITLLIHTYGNNPDAVLIVILMFVASLLFEIIYPAITGRKLKVK